MVKAVIAEKVQSIVDMIESFRKQGSVCPPGWGEMPLDVKTSLGSLLVDCVLCLFPDITEEQATVVCRGMMAVVVSSFLAGRTFGELCASTGIQNVADAVPMVFTEAPTCDYEFTGPVPEGE